MRPDARRERLLLEEIGDELVVYDLQRHRAHQLNRAAALVWQSCDGRKTVAELTKVLQNELNPAADEAIVCKALDRLGKAHLLREAVQRPASAASMTRRQALRKFGRTAALALLWPVVTSITAPMPVQAGPSLALPCDSIYCTKSVCPDQCNTDAQCPKTSFCRLLPCNTKGSNLFCPGCTQRRCVTNVSPSRIRPTDF